jgi:hypothetical protein
MVRAATTAGWAATHLISRKWLCGLHLPPWWPESCTGFVPPTVTANSMMEVRVMAGLGKKLMWMAVGTATSRAVRGATRNALHNRAGRHKLPRSVKYRHGMGTALSWVVGASALMAIADVLKEQSKDAAEVR